MRISKYAMLTKVVEVGSLTKAAQALGCTQSGISHAISALEEELGFTLLERSRKKAALTPEGKQVYPAICHIQAGLDELCQQAEAIRNPQRGVVRVGAFTSVAVHWLPGMIKDFEKEYPNVQFGLINGDYHDVTEAFLQERIDLGFVALPSDLPNCRFVPLVEDRLLAVLPRNHPLASLERYPMQAMEKESFISLLEASDHDARYALELAGVQANVKFTTKDDYAIIAMVEQGLGVSIMPELLMQGHTEKVRVMPLENGAARTIGLAIANASKHNAFVESFARHIKAWLIQRYGAENVLE